MSIKGYSSQKKNLSKIDGIDESLTETRSEYVTVQNVGSDKYALDVLPKAMFETAVADTVEAGSTTRKIVATSHGARAGDVLRFTSGSNDRVEAPVLSVPDANTIVLGAELLATPTAGVDTFIVMRHITLTVTNDGSLVTSPGPLEFILNGSAQQVIEDTTTPANNKPLPVKLTGVDGDVTIDASNANLNVQLDHNSANPDSVRIGDGVETVNINASNEMQVADDTARTSLATIAGDTTSLDAKVPSQGQALMAASVPVAIASDQSNLPIRAISDATDKIKIGDGTDELAINADGSINVVSTDLDVRDLTHVSDSVKIGDGVETVNVNASNELQVADDTARASLSTIAGDTTSIDGKLPTTLGQKASAASLAVVLASDQSTVSVGDSTAQASLSSIDGKLPTTLGQKTKANSLAVTLASDSDAIPASLGRTSVELIRNDYTSTNVTTGAYVELVASTSADINKLSIFDSSGQTLVLATGAAASEVDVLYIFPGGNGSEELNIASGTRLSVKAISATANSGELTINAFS